MSGKGRFLGLGALGHGLSFFLARVGRRETLFQGQELVHDREARGHKRGEGPGEDEGVLVHVHAPTTPCVC